LPIFVPEGSGWDERFARIQQPVHLWGYFQSARYFEDCKDHIRQRVRTFSLQSASAKQYASYIAAHRCYGCHIRRGDYETEWHSKNFGIMEIDYYDRAISRLIKDDTDKPHLLVFSDDITKAKGLLQGYQTAVFIQNTTPVEDLLLMSRCQGNIIANSSFSWWGAWLGSDVTKTIVAPTRWFANIPEPVGIIPESWVRL
jgi:hypothetical protein